MINLILVGILSIAAFFRLFNLSTLPISLFGDEIDVGYHAWSLITTGRDYMGNLLPTYIHSLSEWRAPLLMYITAPFVGILGPTAFAVRLPVALLGVASVYPLYLLVKHLSKNTTLALLSALVLALTPWHIHYSRASFEVVPLIFLLLWGTYLFTKEKYFASLIPFVLTFYTYSTANIFTPLFVLGLLLIYRPKLNLKKNWAKLILPVILILPMAYNVLFGQASGRFGIISVFNDQKIIDQLIIKRTDPWIKASPFETVFHNKYFAYATAIGSNYVSALSPQFLFLKGDPFFRHSISEQGELLWIFLPFFLLGLFALLKNISEKQNKLILLWLLLAPIPSSLTQGGGDHATRLFLMVPPLVLITAMGFWEFVSKIKFKKIFILIIGSLLILAFANYFHQYSIHYKFDSARFWQYGYESIFTQLKAAEVGAKNVYINNSYEPSLLKFAFYTQYPPSKFQKDFQGDQPEAYDIGIFKGFRFGENYFFGQVGNLDDLQKLLQPGDIYLAAQLKEIPGDWDWSVTAPFGLKTVGFTRDLLGQPLFTIVKR
ncbi:MAG: glycosyltransferase family 39 protein [Microgenomates group bacterium]